jgi:hypothetical protein
LSPAIGRDEENKQQELQMWWQRWREKVWTDPSATSAVFIALLTVAIFWATSRQAEATRQSVAAMQESNRVAVETLEHAKAATLHAERPWVGADRFSLLGEFGVGQTMETEVILKNFGKTPAIDFTTWGWSDLMKTLGWPSMNPAAEYGPNVLFPSQMATYPHGLREALSADQFRAIQNHELYFVVAGRLTYKDQRGQGCFTEYCGFYNTSTKGFQMVAGLNRAE